MKTTIQFKSEAQVVQGKFFSAADHSNRAPTRLLLSGLPGNEEDVLGLGERKSRQVSRIELSRILEARAEETLALVFNQLNDWDVLKDLGAGVILTGGGSLLQGLVELAEFTFDVPVRRGVPRNVIGMRARHVPTGLKEAL